MKILLADFNAKVGREDIFKQTIGNESLQEISNVNGVRLVNFATSKNLRVKSTMFPHCNIYKYTWTSPDRKTHNQIDHILIEGKEQLRVEVSSRFAALEDLDAEVEINSAWETIRENIKISAKDSLGYFELKKHKPWFNGGCSRLLDQRKEAKLQWLHDPNEINRDNLKNVRHEASRYFRNKKRDYLKDKINELAMNSKNKNIRNLYRVIN
jgi:hypothetical protein